MVHMAMLPEGHPLHKIVASKVAQKVKKHRAPINQLLAGYKYNTKLFEKIPATACNPS
jgi:hypothetical protein